ncbi:hypothetical protein NPIL_333721, partial [Nephila pilipes]
ISWKKSFQTHLLLQPVTSSAFRKASFEKIYRWWPSERKNIKRESPEREVMQYPTLRVSMAITKAVFE